mmetsp:Transcript_21653/g.21964  ORF Transcript_21653/g.21964 Transcript_21653/m.21964 type:complete len:89 (+) Transcript_21653:334-600(+)
MTPSWTSIESESELMMRPHAAFLFWIVLSYGMKSRSSKQRPVIISVSRTVGNGVLTNLQIQMMTSSGCIFATISIVVIFFTITNHMCK